MTFGPTNGGKLCNVKTHIWANQKTELFVCYWVLAHAILDVTCFPAFVWVADVISSVLLICLSSRCFFLIWQTWGHTSNQYISVFEICNVLFDKWNSFYAFERCFLTKEIHLIPLEVEDFLYCDFIFIGHLKFVSFVGKANPRT